MFLALMLTRTVIRGPFFREWKILTFFDLRLQPPIAKNLNELPIVFISDFKSRNDVAHVPDEFLGGRGSRFRAVVR